MSQLFATDEAGARFSDCRKWRYSLWRVWDSTRSPMVFVGCNPSKANETDGDNTVNLMMKRARMYGFGGLLVLNVFAWVETDSRLLPRLLSDGVDIIGPENNDGLLEISKRGGLVVAGWGNPGNLGGRGQWVCEYLKSNGVELVAFKLNQNGTPVHPLYQPLSLAPKIVL